MPAQNAVAIGRRIKKFRDEKGMSGAELAARAGISRSYLSELENGKGEHKRPSANVMYAIGKALGVSMSELLGRPLITRPSAHRPTSLLKFAEQHHIPDADVDMLASIRFRGDAPQTPERWSFIYNAIKTSVSLDPKRRRPSARPRRALQTPSDDAS
jgi:transcriptional regulator with XRE-family HTH domain